MQILLAPWNRPFTGFTLRIYRLNGKPSNGLFKPYANSYEAEISTFKCQEIAIALIQRHASTLVLTTFNVERSLRMAAVAEVPDEDAEKLLNTLSKLSKLPNSRLIPDELVENPTIEGVERFLSIRKLLD